MPAYKDPKTKTWYTQFYFTNWMGEYKRKKKRGFPRKKDAENWEREFLTVNANKPDITFGKMTELYFEDAKNRIRKTTLATKKNMITTHILPFFEDMLVPDITKSDIRKWQNIMLNKTQKTGEYYKPTYLRSINSNLSAIFNFAVEFYNLPYNPCHRTKAIGKKRAEEMNFWTLDQFNKTIVYEDKPAYHLALMTLYWTGIREGELLALTPKKIIDRTKSLDINESYKLEDGEYVFGEKKRITAYGLFPCRNSFIMK